MTNAVRMQTLVDAHAALAIAQAALETLPVGCPAYAAAWRPVMSARIALSTDLSILQPVEVTPAP